MQRTTRSRTASASVIMLLLGLFQTAALIEPAEAQVEQQLVDPQFGIRSVTGFGTAVAVSGNRILVGSSTVIGVFGTSYLFEPQEDGTWASVAALEGGAAGYNRSVALDGDRALTGVPDFYISRRLPATGAAYVYDRQEDGSWVKSDTLLTSDAEEDAEVGTSVSLDGDRALVGAPGQSGDPGAAYVFERQEDGSWAQVAKLTPDDADVRRQIGWFVSLSGDRALVGCVGTGENEITNSCLPYIFERQGDGSWIQTAKIVTPDAVEQNQSALSGSLEENRAVIGMVTLPSENTVPYTSAYVFEREDDGSWVQVQRLQAQGRLMDQGGDGSIVAGWSVDLDGGRVLLGTIDASNKDGAAYLFERQSDGAWVQTDEITASESSNDLFGFAVALEGDVAVVGTAGTTQSVAYVYSEGTGTPTEGERELSEAALLRANYPNPFGPRTTIPFTIPTATHMTIEIYDVLGREVATLVNGVLTAGNHRVTWEAGSIPSGVYVVRLTTDTTTHARTVVVQK